MKREEEEKKEEEEEEEEKDSKEVGIVTNESLKINLSIPQINACSDNSYTQCYLDSFPNSPNVLSIGNLSPRENDQNRAITVNTGIEARVQDGLTRVEDVTSRVEGVTSRNLRVMPPDDSSAQNDNSLSSKLLPRVDENIDESASSPSTRKVAAIVHQRDPERGTKYYITAKVDKRAISMFVDSGAEVSILKTKDARYFDKKQLKKPILLSGFDGKEGVTAYSFVDIEVDFVPGLTFVRFLVADVPYNILGADALQNSTPNISLHTDTGVLRVGRHQVRTSPSEAESRQSYILRRRDADVGDAGLSGILRIVDDVKIPANDLILVQSALAGKDNNLRGELVLYSVLESADSDIFVPSITFESGRRFYPVPVQNKSGEPIVLKRGTILGRVWSTNDLSCCNVDMEVLDVTDIMNEKFANVNTEVEAVAETEVKVEAKVGSIESKGAPAEPFEPDADELGGQVKFTDIAGDSKVPDETLQRAFREGVYMNLKAKNVSADMDLSEADNLDVEAEKMKDRNKNCPWWTESMRDEFLSQFSLDHLSADDRTYVENLLFDFRGNFANENFPAQFREGINHKPFDIKLIDGMRPKKMKQRDMSEEKEAYMRKHIDQMLAQGVLEELASSEGCFLSPAHIVLETRYLAAQKKTIIKSRFVVDMRSINCCLEDNCHPLPLMDVFRRDVAHGYTHFSAFDGTQYFHQFSVSPATSKLMTICCLNRIFVFRKLLMGCKNSPGLTQGFGDRAFRCHEATKPFLDDFTVRSKGMETHLKKDLPIFLALCSFYRILLKGSKSDIAVPTARILGHECAASSLSLTGEKIKKIEKLEFPQTKKQLVSVLAFFSYFLGLSPRLAELIAPLRKYAVSHVRYAPTTDLRDVFERAKSYLLSPDVGAIRTPSADLDDDLYLFTDSSSTTMSGLLCQKQHPVGATSGPKRLYIVGIYSGTVPSTKKVQPIWALELLALYNSCVKFCVVLLGRVFHVITDSSVVLNWSNMSLVPLDIARRVMYLQRFAYRILYVNTTLNPSDCISRPEVEDETPGRYVNFAENRIVSADGKVIPLEALFSEEKRKAMTEFFGQRRQQLSAPVSKEEMRQEEEVVLREEEEELGELAELVEQPDSEIIEVIEGGEDREVGVRLAVVNVSSVDRKVTVAAVGLTDDDIDDDVVDDGIEELCDGSLDSIVFPSVEGERVEEVKGFQDDAVLKHIKQFVDNSLPSPSKMEALALSVEMRSFLNHRSLFRVNQELLWRLWVSKDGSATPLIFVSEKALLELLRKHHAETHSGFRATFKAFSRLYYAFHMRRIIQKYVSNCASCTLNNHVRGNADKSGNQLSLIPNDTIIIDFLGPLNNFKTAAGKAKYVLLAIDGHTRFVSTFVTTSTADDELLRVLICLRNKLCGLPRRVISDNALLTKHSKSLEYLRSNGTSVLHGVAFVSRCQSKAERAIGSISRLLAKFHTDSPKSTLTELLDSATMAYNSTPHSALPNGKSPRELHFVNPPPSFLDVTKRPEAVGGKLEAALRASDAVVEHEVAQYLQGKRRQSPTDHTSRLKIGQLVMKRRTTYATSSPKKFQFKRKIDGYRIIGKIATNCFKIKSIINGAEEIQAGDHLLKMALHDETSLKKLVHEMQVLSSACDAKCGPMSLRSRRRMARPKDAASATPSLQGIHDDGGKKKRQRKERKEKQTVRRSARLHAKDSGSSEQGTSI